MGTAIRGAACSALSSMQPRRILSNINKATNCPRRAGHFGTNETNFRKFPAGAASPQNRDVSERTRLRGTPAKA
jgi:hypothetical protein